MEAEGSRAVEVEGSRVEGSGVVDVEGRRVEGRRAGGGGQWGSRVEQVEGSRAYLAQIELVARVLAPNFMQW